MKNHDDSEVEASNDIQVNCEVLRRIKSLYHRYISIPCGKYRNGLKYVERMVKFERGKVSTTYLKFSGSGLFRAVFG